VVRASSKRWQNASRASRFSCEGGSFEPSARAWYQAQACFHGEASACAAPPPGPQLTAKPVIETTCLAKDCQLRFIGADGHDLMISSGAERFLVDPQRAAVTERAAFWYLDQLLPRARGAGQQRIWTGAWGWDAATGGIAGLLGLGGEGENARHGLALYSARRASLAPLPLPDTASFAAVEALSPQLRLGVVTIPGAQRRAIVLDLPSGRPLGTPLGGTLSAVAFSADGARVALGFADGGLAVVTAATGAATRLTPAIDPLGETPWSVHSLSFHPTRPWLVATDRAGRVRLWQLDAAAPSSRALSPAERATLAAFSADGRYLALADDRQLVLLDATTLERAGRPAPCPTCADSS
jgi:hypothetical protein